MSGSVGSQDGGCVWLGGPARSSLLHWNSGEGAGTTLSLTAIPR